jgi:hypothetical protein
MAVQTYEEYVRGLSGQERINAMEKASNAIDVIQQNSSSSRSDIARSVYQEQKDWGASSIPANQETNNAVDNLTVTANKQTPQSQSTSFNISNFRNEIERNGVLPQNRFLVVFARPRILSNYYSTDFLTMRCENVTLPGVSFNTTNVIRYGYGQVERRPYLPMFSDIRMSFIVDRSSSVVGFFNNWTNSIVNYDVSKGMYPGDGASKYGSSPYEMVYKDSYICPQMQIYVYDYENKKQIKVTLYDAYPVSTADIDLSWTESNEVLKYGISLRFTNMTMETLNGEQVTINNVEAPSTVTALGQEVQKTDKKEIQKLQTKIPNPTF